MAGGLPRTRAVVFIILLGAISLFADMTYEGARSITGPDPGALGLPPRRSASSPASASSSATRCASALDISPMPAAGIGPRSRPRVSVAASPRPAMAKRPPPKSRAEIEVPVDLPRCTRHAAGSLRFTNSCGKTWRAPSRHSSSRYCRGKQGWLIPMGNSL